MDPNEQGDAVAKRRREQNRLAQRRFRWKQSQNKATAREQGKQQKQKQQSHQKSTSTSGQEVHLYSPPIATHQQARPLRPSTTIYPSESYHLVTPSPSSSNITTDQILSPDLFQQFLFRQDDDNNDITRTFFESSQGSTNESTNESASRTERARSLASGMGGLLGDLGTAWDFGSSGAFSRSPPPLALPHQPTFHEEQSGDHDKEMTPSFVFPTEPAIDKVGSFPFPDIPATATRSLSLPLASYQDSTKGNYPLLVHTEVDYIGSDLGKESWDPQKQLEPVPNDFFDDGMGASMLRPIRGEDQGSIGTSKQRTGHNSASSSSQRYQQKRRDFYVTEERDSPSTYQEEDESASDPEEWLSPLHLAASKGHDRIVRMILKKHQLQPAIDELDSNGQTALMHAVQGGFQDVVLTLLNAGATVDSARDNNGQTALHWAVLKRRRTILRHLLEKGNQSERGGSGQRGETQKRRVMDVDVYDGEGLTPLHRAIDSGFDAGVELLLEFGANLASRIRAAPQKIAAGPKEKHRGGKRSGT